MMLLDAVVAFAVAAATSLACVPLVARLATRLGAVDAPDGKRKHQKQAVPLGGGIAVVIAASAGLLVASLTIEADLEPSVSYGLAAVPSVLVLLAVGLLDDTIGLTGIYKLIGQMLAASLLVAGGFKFETVSLFGANVPLGDFGIPFSIFFCLGAINAFNLIDGADGLAASIGAIVCVTLGIIAGLQGAHVAGLACLAVAGGLIGFLRYNAAPARIYLGDTGSMFIGWLVAAVAIRSSIKQQAAMALAVPVAICAIPILDAAAAMIRRITTGQSVFAPDRGHLHHALQLRGLSVRQTAGAAAALTAVTCTGALFSYLTGHEIFAMVAIAGVVSMLIAARVFGHAEMALLYSHFRGVARRAVRHVRPSHRGGTQGADSAIQIQGRRQWAMLWQALREAAQQHDLGSLKLVVNIPFLHESFFATWQASEFQSGGEQGWKMAVPLSYSGRSVGQLTIEGRAGRGGLGEMQAMLDYLEPLEGEVARLVDEVEADLAANKVQLGSRRPSNDSAAVAASAADYY